MKIRNFILTLFAAGAALLSAWPLNGKAPRVDERFDRSGCTVGAPTDSRAIQLIFTAD